MVCSYYIVRTYNGMHEKIVEHRVYSFDEALYFINLDRDKYVDALSFEISYPLEEYAKEMIRR